MAKIKLGAPRVAPLLQPPPLLQEGEDSRGEWELPIGGAASRAGKPTAWPAPQRGVVNYSRAE